MIRRLSLIIALCVTLGCDSGPTTMGRLIRGRVVDCKAPAAGIEERIGYWEQHLPDATHAGDLRPDWREESRRLPLKYPGLMVKIRLDTIAEIVLDRKAGVAQSARIKPWANARAKEEWFFTTELGCDCGGNLFEKDAILFAGWMPPQGVPPQHIAPFFGVDQLSRAPILFTEYWKLDP